ncbi:MAG: CCA tRNA nucleotidyltransferase [Alphaproteobacteria bacterium]
MKTKIKPSFLELPEIKNLFDIFKRNHSKLFIVGGAVRDFLCKKTVNDIDFATDLSPKEIIKLLERNCIKSIPTGEKHGTITAILNKKNYEITTFRNDKKTDGRHADVEFISSIKNDALRRDFTINALYLDENGEIFDYVNGLKDLEKKEVKFIGKAEKRIEEDYLRILRFFRFSSSYSNEINKENLLACVKFKSKLKELSNERVLEEMSKIVLTKNVVSTIETMIKTKIFNEIFPKFSFEKRQLKKLIKADKSADAIIRLSLIIKELYTVVRISNKDKKRIKILEKLHQNPPSVFFVIYYYGKKVAEDLSLICDAKNIKCFSYKKVQEVYPLPKFQITGNDLLKQGFKGKELGEKLKELEQNWLGTMK